MSSSSKRSWKLQEFVAHSSNVTCLSIGPSSGRVMVTGGEDKKVNMWAIGKPNVILSLSGHTTPIECVQFNNSEELVCAGSSSGALKIWDLDSAKVVRTLTGHKANIKSLDFHPYGEFIASGSMDTTVRLWDIRRKGCIVSYKGHTNTVNHLRFSPDGRWVISAGEDGIVKLWDLNAGKLLADFILHTGPVNCVEFHPREFLIATGSSDRTVKYWDLETFGLISSSDLEASPVRTVCFHPEGVCLFSGGQDSLRAHLWEPSVCFDSQTLGWGKITDMAFSSNQLIGASYQATNVSVWVSSMNNIETMAEKANAETYVGKVEVNQSVQQINSRKHRLVVSSVKICFGQILSILKNDFQMNKYSFLNGYKKLNTFVFQISRQS
uniref:Katanin p80 WD40 repeat-containing subunit B1 n=1 Tax=Clytia hemisphaerica TaxID=252671 RepID=A0A7M5V3L1_9CNID